MPLQSTPALPREVTQRAAPVFEGGSGPFEFPIYGIEYEVQQIALGGDVMIERHWATVELRGDSPDGDGRQTVLVRQRYAGRDDSVPG